jgi:predicted glutamine amidotransferase
MCRWLAYTGSPVLLTQVLYTPVHSLIDQSLHSRLGAETTNGDGFGVGWYDAAPAPGIFRSIEPAWNDENLRELAGHISSHLFFAHIRAAIGSAVQQTNCHPFRHGRWLFMHNGFIDGFAAIKRDLVLAVDESLFPEIMGTADTEVLFCLALTFGLEDDPPGAVARAIGLVEACGRARDVEYPFQGTIATTDGETLWVFRYSSAGTSRSLFFTRDVRMLRQRYPDREILREVSDDARLVVSEPIGDLPGAWIEMPEASYGVVSKGGDQLLPFTPEAPPEVRLRPDLDQWHGLAHATCTCPAWSPRCTGSLSSRPVMRMIFISRGGGATRCNEDPACPACLLIRTSAPRPRASQKLRPAMSSRTCPPRASMASRTYWQAWSADAASSSPAKVTVACPVGLMRQLKVSMSASRTVPGGCCCRAGPASLAAASLAAVPLAL